MTDKNEKNTKALSRTNKRKLRILSAIILRMIILPDALTR